MRSTSALVFSILRISLDSILRLGLCACMGVPCKDGEIARGGLIPCLTDPPSMSHRRSISKRKKKEEKNETEKAQGGGKGGMEEKLFCRIVVLCSQAAPRLPRETRTDFVQTPAE